MQLSASLLPFDIPAAGIASVPIGTVPAANAGSTADFGALLNAESSPLAPASPEPEIPGETATSVVSSELAEELPSVEDRPWSALDEASHRANELSSDVLPQPVPPPTTTVVATSSVTPEIDESSEALSGEAEPKVVSAPAAEHGTITSLRQASARETSAKEIRPSRGFSREVAAGTQTVPASPARGDTVERPSRSHRMVRNEVESEDVRSRTPPSGAVVPRENPSNGSRAAAPQSADISVFETPQTVASTNAGAEDVARAFVETRSTPATSPAPTPARTPAAEASIVRSSTDAPAFPQTSDASRADFENHQTQASAQDVPASRATPSDAPADYPKRTAVSPAGVEHRGVPVAESDIPRRALPSLSVESRPEVFVASTLTPAAATAISRIQNSDTPATPAIEAVAGESSEMPWAKFAAPSAGGTQTPPAVYKGGEKNTQVTKNEGLEIVEHSLGTNVAKAEALMPAADLASTSVPHAIERLSHAVAPLASEFSLGEERAEPVEIAQAARRAVNAAIAVTEQFATERKPAVTLKFTVSGVDLGVRVELRGENVHTTFRTDSPELRAALAQEWNHVAAAQPGDRAARLAEPVFASNHNAPASSSASSHGSTQSDSGAADQRGFQQRHEHAAAADWARFRAVSRASHSTPTSLPEPALAGRAVASVAPGRLRTFA